MRRATLPTLLIAAAIPLATAVALAPTASAATCSDLEVVFARGSGEAQGLGIVGTPFVSAVKKAVPTLAVTSYAVNYAASVDQSSAGPGATDMSNHVTSQAAACPGQRFVLGGYSQGASVVDIAIGAGGYLGQGGRIPASLAPRVAAVAVFGNPLRQPIKNVSTTYGPKSIDICNTGDPVCGSQGTGPGNGHLSYGSDGSTTLAAAFVAKQVAGTPAPTTPLTTAPTTVPTSPVTTVPTTVPTSPITTVPTTVPTSPITTAPTTVPTTVPTTPPTTTPTPPPSTGWMGGFPSWWSGISHWFGGFFGR